MNITIFERRCAAALASAVGIFGSAQTLRAQTLPAHILPAQTLPAQIAAHDMVGAGPGVAADSARRGRFREDSVRNSRGHFYRRFAAGVAGSILLHEAAHFTASYAMGFHPHFGLDKGRPTAFSGIDELVDRRQQFIFSAAGLTVQNLLDELLLDIPHRRGGAFERGILAGGIGTTLFYVTVGRNARVSDITVMDRVSHLSRSQLSMIFGSVAALHAVRMSRNGAYSHFFLAPADRGNRLKAGLALTTH